MAAFPSHRPPRDGRPRKAAATTWSSRVWCRRAIKASGGCAKAAEYGNLETLVWTKPGSVRATGWAFLADAKRAVDAVLVTHKERTQLVPVAATVPIVPRPDVAQQLGSGAMYSGWTLDFDLRQPLAPLEFWVFDARARHAFPICSITGDYAPRMPRP